jgi:hypothetical protein
MAYDTVRVQPEPAQHFPEFNKQRALFIGKPLRAFIPTDNAAPDIFIWLFIRVSYAKDSSKVTVE